MRRIEGPVFNVRIETGFIRASAFKSVTVGDLLIPEQIEVDEPGAPESDQPSRHMFIEVIDGVPRCTELTFQRREGGREIRPKDLKDTDIDGVVESVVQIVAGQVLEQDDSGLKGVFPHRGNALPAIRSLRRNSRRPITDNLLERVAETYNAQETGGLDAVERAFAVSRATAARYVRAAREKGFIK